MPRFLTYASDIFCFNEAIFYWTLLHQSHQLAAHAHVERDGSSPQSVTAGGNCGRWLSRNSPFPSVRDDRKDDVQRIKLEDTVVLIRSCTRWSNERSNVRWGPAGEHVRTIVRIGRVLHKLLVPSKLGGGGGGGGKKKKRRTRKAKVTAKTVGMTSG
jgi:hypothetical protein